MIALDAGGRVVVIEVKRSIERTQLAQCLEYAGWARRTNLDELAGLYHRGVAAFFSDWQEFTKTSTPLVVNPAPRLVLVAARFDDRTSDALGFLKDSGTPVELVPVTLYRDPDGERLLHVDTEIEADTVGVNSSVAERTSPRQWRLNGRRFEVGDLLEAGMIAAAEPLVWRRRAGVTYHATVTEEGTRSGSKTVGLFDTPSAAAMAVANANAVSGWEVWRRDDRFLMDLRSEVLRWSRCVVAARAASQLDAERSGCSSLRAQHSVEPLLAGDIRRQARRQRKRF